MAVVDLESNGILSTNKTKVCRACGGKSAGSAKIKVVEWPCGTSRLELEFEFKPFLSVHPFLY
jgi:hypothetical protein